MQSFLLICHFIVLIEITKTEFNDSPTGLSVEELMLRCEKYENAKSSYWRSEERRRVRL